MKNISSNLLFTAFKTLKNERTINVEGNFKAFSLNEFEFDKDSPSSQFLIINQDFNLNDFSTNIKDRDENVRKYLFETKIHGSKINVSSTNEEQQLITVNDTTFKITANFIFSYITDVKFTLTIIVNKRDDNYFFSLAQPLETSPSALGLPFSKFLAKVNKNIPDRVVIDWSAAHYSEDKSKQTIIVGGGISGLAAAHALALRGQQVTLVERNNYFGGKANSYIDESIGYTVEHGIHGMFPSYVNFKKLIREAQISNDIYVSTKTTGLVVKDKIVTTHIGDSDLPFPFYLLKILPKQLKGLINLFFSLPVIMRFSATNTLNDESLDSETFNSLLRRYGATEKMKYSLFIPYVRNLCYAEGTQVSAHTAVEAINYYLMNSANNVNAKWFNGGPDELIFNPWVKFLARQGVQFKMNLQISDLLTDKNIFKGASVDTLIKESNFGDIHKGWVENFNQSDYYLTWYPDTKKLTAISATCTHMGCPLTADGENGLKKLSCPCHNGQFTTEGVVTQGPPKENLESFTTKRIKIGEEYFWQILNEGSNIVGDQLVGDNLILSTDITGAQKLISKDLLINTDLHDVQNLDTTDVVVLRMWLNIDKFEGPDSGVFAQDDVLDNFFVLNRFQDEFKNLDQTVIECHISNGKLFNVLSTKEIYLQAIDLLNKYFPFITIDTLDYENSRILQHKNTFTLFAPGDLVKYPYVANESRPNIYITGDWVRSKTSNWYMERAAVTGLEAANEILKKRNSEPFNIEEVTKVSFIYRLLGLPIVFMKAIISFIRKLFRLDTL